MVLGSALLADTPEEELRSSPDMLYEDKDG
jgi:hypothetical protein